MGRFSTFAQVVLGLLCVGGVVAQNDSTPTWPLHDNGFTKLVQWDHYSFLVNGERIFLFSGEFHYWRLPVPELWEDILVKVKASGCNAISIYGHWSFHSPSPDVLDFESGAHNIRPIFEIAKRIGLYVIVRPGPYVNAESNAGGFPGWLTTGAYGTLRNNDSRYTKAWEPYQSKYAQITREYQVTNGGTALLYQIENEYGNQWNDAAKKIPNDTAIEYMELLRVNARDNGITIPDFHNNPNLNSKSWSTDYGAGFGGNTDTYGVDAYPACWSCYIPTCEFWNGPNMPFKVDNYYSHFESVAWTQPGWMPEFQGGSYNPWNGPAGGCVQNTDWDFANLYYRHNIAERITAVNLYMIYGGTNWGWLAFPLVGTSYDYSSPIAEDRSLRAKYSETKLLALFTRVAADLRKTDRLGNSTSYSSNPRVMATELRNPDTGAAFYVTVHANTSSDTVERFKLKVNMSIGALTIPQGNGSIVLNGHQSKIIVTDFRFGERVLTYSTAEVLTYAIINGKPVLAVWVPDGESAEFHVKGAKNVTLPSEKNNSNVSSKADKHGLRITFDKVTGSIVLTLNDGVRIIVLDRTSAYELWAPVTTSNPLAPVNETILVRGSYLIRSASYSADGATVHLTGDFQWPNTAIEVFASSTASKLSWNSQPLRVTKTSYGSLTALLNNPRTATLDPILGPWKVADSLPERLNTYNDSGPAWVTADHNTTASVYKNATKPYLYVDEYGFHNGIHLFRGRFTGTGATGVYIQVQGGAVFGFSVWLNGAFLGSWLGDIDSDSGNLTLPFSSSSNNSTLLTAGENVLLVVQDNSGHDQTTSALNPRGIINATLLGPNTPPFDSWKIAGTAGAEKNIDRIRGPLNEGGLYAERLGWHLPGFNSTSWPTSPSPTLSLPGPGIKFFRTTFPLSIPPHLDAAFSFRFTLPPGASKKIRVLLFVNGWQYGRWNPWSGNENEFPVPREVLDFGGVNTVGVSVWAQGMEGAEVRVEVLRRWVLESGLRVGKGDGEGGIGKELRTGWDGGRLVYA